MSSSVLTGTISESRRGREILGGMNCKARWIEGGMQRERGAAIDRSGRMSERLGKGGGPSGDEGQ